MSRWLGIVALAVLVACASSKKENGRDQSAKFSDGLRVGMTKGEVEKLGVVVGNCRGGSQGVSRCEVLFDLAESHATPYTPDPIGVQPPPVQNPGALNISKRRAIYDVYLLDFEGEHLKMWKRASDLGL